MWASASSAGLLARLASAFRAFATKSQTASAAISGPAANTATQARLDALRLYNLDCQIAELNRLHRNDPRRAKLRKAIYSARHDILRGHHARG